MRALNLTPPERLVDAAGRPYFLWDVDMTLDVFRARLVDSDPEVRAHFLAKLMRQARPDDVLALVGTRKLREAWESVREQLGDKRDFWAWWLEASARHEAARQSVADPTQGPRRARGARAAVDALRGWRARGFKVHRSSRRRVSQPRPCPLQPRLPTSTCTPDRDHECPTRIGCVVDEVVSLREPDSSHGMSRRGVVGRPDLRFVSNLLDRSPEFLDE